MINTLCVSDCCAPDALCCLQGNLLNCIHHAKLLGFDGVEIHMRNAKLNDYYELADYAAKENMKVTTIGTGMACYKDGHYLTNPDPDKLKDAQQVLIDFLKAGHILGGAPVMFGLMKGPLPSQRYRDKYTDILFENLKPVVEAAEKYDTDLTIEAISRFQADYLWTAEETLDFVNRFKSDHVTVHLDSCSMNIEEKDPVEAIRICKGKLGHFHFSDSNRCYPGAGNIDFKALIDALYDIGYAQNGLGGHEYHAWPDGVTAATRGLAHIKQFLRDDK